MLNENTVAREQRGEHLVKTEPPSVSLRRILSTLFERKDELFAEIAELTAALEKKGREYDQITAMLRAAATYEKRAGKR